MVVFPDSTSLSQVIRIAHYVCHSISHGKDTDSTPPRGGLSEVERVHALQLLFEFEQESGRSVGAFPPHDRAAFIMRLDEAVSRRIESELFLDQDRVQYLLNKIRRA